MCWALPPSHNEEKCNTLAEELKPSYWLILKREGFSGDLFQASDEMADLAKAFDKATMKTPEKPKGHLTLTLCLDSHYSHEMETAILNGTNTSDIRATPPNEAISTLNPSYKP